MGEISEANVSKFRRCQVFHIDEQRFYYLFNKKRKKHGEGGRRGEQGGWMGRVRKDGGDANNNERKSASPCSRDI